MLRRLTRLMLVCFLSLAASGSLIPLTQVQAQITLRPVDEPARSSRYTPDYDNRRDRERSSRLDGVVPSFEQREFAASGSAQSGSREEQRRAIQREAVELDRQLGHVRRIVKFASPSIVHIEATKTADSGHGFASNRIEEAGAGVVVNIDGSSYVLTNRHVIHPASSNSIRLELANGRVLRPSRVWTDPSTDVAVMRVDESGLIAAELGDSDTMDIGDFVLAVGSPFGLSHSVTYGILSAKGRRNLELGSKEIEIQDFFQTDAAINPGNSGGPLLNLRGEVIAINTAIASNSGGNEGIGFSIPINMALSVAEQLVTRGKLARSYLGVQMDNRFDVSTAQRLGLDEAYGALVKSVIPDSPAEAAGIRPGDVILEFNGLRVQNDGHLVKSVGLTPSGSNVSILILREGSPQRIETRLKPLPQ
jgi:serine protease Do